MSETTDPNTLKSKKYFVAVQQMQYFEIGNCELDSSIVEMEIQKIINI